jgi:hypothetical protein
MATLAPSWSSNYSNWYKRTTPLPSTILLLDSDLLFMVNYEARGGGGFHLALFKPNIAVTSTGQIRKIDADDFAGFTKLAEEVSALPTPETDRSVYAKRAFRVRNMITCRPFTILNISKDSDTGQLMFDSTSVYGFSKNLKDLESSGTLPDVLWDLLGLVTEVPSQVDAEIDEHVLEKIKAIKI